MGRGVLFCCAALGFAMIAGPARSDTASEDAANRYVAVPGGWNIHITGVAQKPAAAQAGFGIPKDDPRTHRRPLFPPADKSLVWTEAEREHLQRCSFRPIVLAYNAPRFLFDYHSAGGLLGHLFLGVVNDKTGESAWLHEWSDLDVSYTDGTMRYVVRDLRFPSVRVELDAAPLADADGLIVRAKVVGDIEGLSLVWMYGGASAFLTNYAMNAPEFTFAPGQCAKDRFRYDAGVFTLRRAFDDTDVYAKEVYAAVRYLPKWEAVIACASSWNGDKGYGQPDAVLKTPAELCSATGWLKADSGEHKNCVAVERVPLTHSPRETYIVIGMGGGIDEDLRHPASAWKASMARNRSIADRVVVDTPDPCLNAAVTMMAFATEGTWGDSAIVHGGWSWRYAYLGWRTWYGPDCYGWTDRIRRSIERQTTLGLVREGPDAGALGSLLEYSPGVYYNMNEVFLDHVRHYFEYTNDIELMRGIFPVLKGIVAWEDRRLQPEGKALYESCLDTWISDSHWYIGGQCTQASAYMLNANRLLADLAGRLGEDPGPYRQRAGRIRAAMQETLWMPEQGVFAEYKDTRGERMLHPEPELPTIYHSAEFGAASPEQIARMLQWGDAHLRHETTPNGGQLVWSSNWFPNNGRSYTHSTYEMAYGEELNYALTNYMAGRAEDAYAIIRASLCGIFNGPTPGGLACHAYSDGTQRANDEFADAISMWDRCVVEGLFGIVPKRPDGIVALSPQFPADWDHASIATPQFSYRWQRRRNTVTIHWKSPVETKIALHLPIPGNTIGRAVVNHREVTAAVEPGFLGVNWANLETGPAMSGAIQIEYGGTPPTPLAPLDTKAPEAPITPWSPPTAGPHDLAQWTLIDLAPTYNASVTEVLQRLVDTAVAPELPAMQVGFGYWKDHLTQYHGSRNQPISDAAWRAKIDGTGVGWTTDGIPFRSPKEGPNIGVVTRAGGFPKSLTVPAHVSGSRLFLMLSGMTFPAQSGVVNLRVSLAYTDGQRIARDLANPTGIGDCWSTWCGRFHDTAANGFENIGGRTGPAGSSEVKDLTQPVALDTEAQLLSLELRHDAELESVTLEAVANDVVFGIMGASVLRQN